MELSAEILQRRSVYLKRKRMLEDKYLPKPDYLNVRNHTFEEHKALWEKQLSLLRAEVELLRSEFDDVPRKMDWISETSEGQRLLIWGDPLEDCHQCESLGVKREMARPQQYLNNPNNKPTLWQHNRIIR